MIEHSTLGEYRSIGEGEDNKYVLNCHNNKTGPQGVAKLVMNEEAYHLLQKYTDLVRDKISAKPGCEDLLFLTVHGTKYTQVYRKIKEQFATDITPSTPSEYRIVVQTDATSLPPNVYKEVTKHLSHSKDTSRRFYEFMNTYDALSAYTVIKQMAERRKWTNKETEILLNECPLSAKKPDIKTCKQVNTELYT